jgi:hypothetical protein
MHSLNQYLNSDKYGQFIILKVNDSKALENMQKGEFWFRHPAFYNSDYDEKSTKTDKYDNRIKSITISQQNIEEGKIAVSGEIDACNKEVMATIRAILFCCQDNMRQISFYKLRINGNGDYLTVDNKMREFGDKFAFVNISKIYDHLKQKGIEFQLGDCIYEDENNYKSNFESFYKRKRFCYQKECRIILSSDAYMQKVNNNESLQELYREERIFTGGLCAETTEKRIEAENKLYDIEKKILQIKGQYIEMVDIAPGLLSEILPISTLLQNTCLSVFESLV